MTIEGLKALCERGKTDCGYTAEAGEELLGLWTEILALVEALRDRDTTEHDLPKEVRKTLYDFNAALAEL